MRTVTVADIIDAMERNGYKQIQGAFIKYDVKNDTYVGCAIGQAAINLGSHWDDISYELGRIGRDWSSNRPYLRDFIVNLNDMEGMSIPRIVQEVRKLYADILENTVEIWNDVDYFDKNRMRNRIHNYLEYNNRMRNRIHNLEYNDE